MPNKVGLAAQPSNLAHPNTWVVHLVALTSTSKPCNDTIALVVSTSMIILIKYWQLFQLWTPCMFLHNMYISCTMTRPNLWKYLSLNSPMHLLRNSLRVSLATANLSSTTGDSAATTHRLASCVIALYIPCSCSGVTKDFNVCFFCKRKTKKHTKSATQNSLPNYNNSPTAVWSEISPGFPLFIQVWSPSHEPRCLSCSHRHREISLAPLQE